MDANSPVPSERTKSEAASLWTNSEGTGAIGWIKSEGTGDPDSPQRSQSERRVTVISSCTINEETLRAVQARSCTSGFGKLLRSSAGSEQTYLFSKQVARISSFWSHSWRASIRQKITTLLYVYNCRAAVFFSLIVAILAAVFVNLGYLPGQACFSTECVAHSDCGSGQYCARSSITGLRCMHEAFCCGAGSGGLQSIDGQCPLDCNSTYRTAPFHLWPLILGACCFIGLIFLWQPSEHVFLDKVCIHQTDLIRKQRGIDGLGGFLYNSNRMTIFWDASYFSRLWCVFEIAAFIYLHGPKAKIEIVPITRGYVIVAGILINIARAAVGEFVAHLLSSTIGYSLEHAILWFFGIWCIHLSRAYARDYIHMKAQIASFVPKDADCFCCTVGHKLPSGAPISCDRKAIYAAIRTWYDGGLEEFQQVVRTSLHAKVQDGLGSMYSYSDALIIGLPTAFIHLSAARMFCVSWTSAKYYFPTFLYTWFGIVPMMVALISVISIIAHAEHARWQCDLFKSVCLSIPWAGFAFGAELLRSRDIWRTIGLGVFYMSIASVMLSSRFFSLLLAHASPTGPVNLPEKKPDVAQPETVEIIP